MLYYILLCLMTTLAGLGVLNLAKIQLPGALNYFLAPLITSALWVIYLGCGIYSGFTVEQLSFWGWLATTGLVIVSLFYLPGVIKKKDFFNQFKLFSPIALMAFIFPILLIAPYFYFGLTQFFGVPAADSWSYASVGQYLWTYPIDTTQKLSPMYQYGTMYLSQRIISHGLLAYLSPFIGSPGNTYATINLLVAWDYFIFSMACAFFITSQNTVKRSYFYLPLTILSFALVYPLTKCNFDNLLTLAIFPTLVALILFTPFQPRAWIVIATLLLADLAVAYVELFPLVICGVGIVFLARLCSDLKNLKGYVISAITSIALTFLILLPILGRIIHYFFWQLNSTHQEVGTRPGDAGYMTTLAAHPIDTLIPYFGVKVLVLLSIGLLVFLWIAFTGLRTLWREKNYGLIGLTAVAVILFSVFFFHIQYAYGAYKIILLHWWLISFILMTGILTIISRRKNQHFFTKNNLILVGCCWVMLNLLLGWYYVHRAQQKFIPTTAKNFYIEPLTDANKIPQMVGNKTVLVTVNNDILHLWAIYILRNSAGYFQKTQRTIITPVTADFAQKILNQAAPVNTKGIVYQLTDYPVPQYKLIWSNGFYYLWERPKSKINKIALNDKQHF